MNGRMRYHWLVKEPASDIGRKRKLAEMRQHIRRILESQLIHPAAAVDTIGGDKHEKRHEPCEKEHRFPAQFFISELDASPAKLACVVRFIGPSRGYASGHYHL